MQNHHLNTELPGATNRKDGHVLGDYPHQFRAYLESRSYAPKTLDQYVRAVSALGVLMPKHNIALADLNEDEAVRLFAKTKWPACKRQHGNYMVSLVPCSDTKKASCWSPQRRRRSLT